MGAPRVNHWLQDIMRRLSKQPDEIPKGWESSREIADKLRCAHVTAQRMTALALKAGLVEMRKFNLQCGKRVYPVMHYRKK